MNIRSVRAGIVVGAVLVGGLVLGREAEARGPLRQRIVRHNAHLAPQTWGPGHGGYMIVKCASHETRTGGGFIVPDGFTASWSKPVYKGWGLSFVNNSTDSVRAPGRSIAVYAVCVSAR